MYTVLQIKLSDEVYNFVNSAEGGHANTAKKFPAYHAYMETMIQGSNGYKPEFIEHYAPVCRIDADSLNHVFEIGNIGPEESIERLAPMHSISVGDIIEDEQGNRVMVDSFGFGEIA